MFKRIAIFGLGLLGGSICKAVKAVSPATEILVFGRDKRKLEPALKQGMADHADVLDNAVLKGVDLAVVSTPAVSSIEIIRKILDRDDLEKHALVTDVGSVKGEIVREIETHARAAQFIGCHPMAGSEKTGYGQSRPDLYANAWVLITPHAKNRHEDIERLKYFWEELSARTALIPADEHDVLLSLTSHAPHIASCALVKMLKDHAGGESLPGKFGFFIGSGFMDVTRLASGSPDMWRDICVLNRKNIIKAVSALMSELEEFRNLMSSEKDLQEKIHSYFSEIKKSRDGIR